eukprot:CAMPEP_0116871632 /NCGR_PEP_ID=MMETSP0463-20121206/2082_1 /TAXON_ID=181622 /ORGANISM="Strombidinopsis sp, Strain SopsisLIS2011" /LENGTH=113 /DNA_ID=CAMNT_0004510447 /DNA_START=1651 /DNA_END=1991 /DNA_ORIENTATION=+
MSERKNLSTTQLNTSGKSTNQQANGMLMLSKLLSNLGGAGIKESYKKQLKLFEAHIKQIGGVPENFSHKKWQETEVEWGKFMSGKANLVQVPSESRNTNPSRMRDNNNNLNEG